MLITLEQHGIFDQIKHINACQHYLTTDVCNSLFDGRGFAEPQFNRLITLEPHGIFGSNFAYLLILTLSSRMQYGDEALPSIFLAYQSFF